MKTIRKKKTRAHVEFGDFQTPLALARRVCETVSHTLANPTSILEPTCGTGRFLLATVERFPDAANVVGLDINAEYLRTAADTLTCQPHGDHVQLLHRSFFDTDWGELFGRLSDPLLVIGNPPWVTNAQLGMLKSTNRPQKTNFQNRSGLDALTGKSNFDISEWMLIRLLERLDGRDATLAMLCKRAVARKVLAHAWRQEIPLGLCEIHAVDAMRHFGAAVDACLLVCRLASSSQSRDCTVYESLHSRRRSMTMGYRDGRLVGKLDWYESWKHLEGESLYVWRSGIKHDCAKVMELRPCDGGYRNGLGEVVNLEDIFLYPMLKGSEIAADSDVRPSRRMLVTQASVGDDTGHIREDAPKTWRYLEEHSERLGRRGSSIYKGRPRFAIFGVGEYSFAPWKVAICGLYKKLKFKIVGPAFGKPTVLDDTAYFLSCETRAEAEYIASLLNTETARQFYGAFIFWDAKRPVTIDVLRRLDISALARECGSEARLSDLARQPNAIKRRPVRTDDRQKMLF